MRSYRSHRRKLLGGLLAGVTVAGITAAAGSASAAASPPRQPLAGSTPGWLGQARDLGAVPSGEPVDFGVLLGMRDQAGTAATLQAVSEPGGARYGHWLTGKAFDARFGPAKATVAAVQRCSAGRVSGTTTLPSGMYIETTGSARQVEKIFATRLHSYSYGA